MRLSAAIGARFRALTSAGDPARVPTVHQRMRMVLAVITAVYLAVAAALLLIERDPGLEHLAAAGLLVGVGTQTWLARRDSERPWWLDVLEVSAVTVVAVVFQTPTSLEFAYVLVVANATLYRTGRQRALLCVLFTAAIAVTAIPVDTSVVSTLVNQAPRIVAVVVLVGLFGDLGRHADRMLRQEQILVAAGTSLATASETRDVAEVAADATRRLLAAAGVSQPTLIGVHVGDEHSLRVLAADGAGAEQLRDRLVRLDALRESSFTSLLDRVLDPREVRIVEVDPREMDGVRDLLGIAVGAPPGALVVPLFARRRLRGLLMLGGISGDTGRFGVSLVALASAVALTLDGLNLTADLASRERRLVTLLASSSDVITVFDADLVAQFESPAVAQFGWSRAQVEGSHVRDIVWDARDAVEAEAVLRRALASPGVAHTMDFRVRTREGEIRYLEGIATNLLHDPDVGGILVNSRDITERKALEERLAHQAVHDPLTGLANRTLFTDRIGHAIERNRRGASNPAVCFLDLDDFKPVNDAHGHGVGDRILVAVAARLVRLVREPDTVARLGGDEFAVLCEDLSGVDAERICARLASGLAEPLEVDGRRFVVSASVGLAVAEPGWSGDELLHAADTAMYAVKVSGKHAWRRYSREMSRPRDGAARRVADGAGRGGKATPGSG